MVDPLLDVLLQSEENPQETFDTCTADYTATGLTGITLPHSACMYISLNVKTYSEHNTCIIILASHTTAAYIYIPLFTPNCPDNFEMACNIVQRNLCNHFKDFLTLGFSNEKQPRRIIVYPKYYYFVS